MLTKEDAEKQKKQAEKILELYKDLGSLQKCLTEFKDSTSFTISPSDTWALPVPVETSIAKQIGYKYYNDLSYDIKQQLADMGFTWEEKPNEK